MNEATYKRLETKIYAACLQAIEAMGPEIKKLSWFGRNAKRLPSCATEANQRSPKVTMAKAA